VKAPALALVTGHFYIVEKTHFDFEKPQAAAFGAGTPGIETEERGIPARGRGELFPDLVENVQIGERIGA
jgi:hypothetical protein